MTDNTDIEKEPGIQEKRTPGGGSPAPPDTWYNLTESDIATMGTRNRRMLREYLLDLRDDVRDGYVSGPDEMPPGITTEREMLREIRETLDATNEAMYQRSDTSTGKGYTRSKNDKKSQFGADAMLGELGFQPSHRGAGYAQCIECGEHVRRTQLDLHIANCPQRSKADGKSQFLCPECGGMTYAGHEAGERFCPECDEFVEVEQAVRVEGQQKGIQDDEKERAYDRVVDRVDLSRYAGNLVTDEYLARRNPDLRDVRDEAVVMFRREVSPDIDAVLGNDFDRDVKSHIRQTFREMFVEECEELYRQKARTGMRVEGERDGERMSQKDIYPDWEDASDVERHSKVREWLANQRESYCRDVALEAWDYSLSDAVDMVFDDAPYPVRRDLPRSELRSLRETLREDIQLYMNDFGMVKQDGTQSGGYPRTGPSPDVGRDRNRSSGKQNRSQKMNYQGAKTILSDVVDNNFAGMRYSIEPTPDGALLDTGSRSRAISEAIRDMADARADTGTVVVEPDGGAYSVRFITQPSMARDDNESSGGEMTADKRLGDPTMGPNLPHREELEDKSTANLKRLKNYYLRQYEDEPDTTAAQNILMTVRDVEDILARRGVVERAENIRDDWIDALSKDEDPCEDGWTMLGLKPNGNPRCVPEEDAEDYDPNKAEKDEPEVAEGLEDACWDGYVAVGMKEDPDGEGMVPDCVPVDEAEGE